MQDTDFTPWPDSFAQHYRDRGYWQGKPLGNLLRDASTKFSQCIAVIDGDAQLSYAQLDLAADELAAGLLETGVEAGEHVLLQLPNIAEFFIALFALFRIGAIPLFALPAHRLAELQHFCRLADARTAIIADRAGGFDYRDIARTLVQAGLLRQVVVVGDAQEFTAFNSLYRVPRPQPAQDATRTALLQISGGTTSLPKLIPRTHDDYFYSVRASAGICEINAQSVYLAVLPVAHNFPLSSPGALGTLHAGGTVVLAPGGAPDIAFALIEKHSVTVTALVPPLAQAWLAAVNSSRHDLGSLQLLQVGGARLPAPVAEKIPAAFGCRLQQVFGMAEGLVNYTRPRDGDDIVFHTQGRPISADDDIRIVDESGDSVPAGQAGELQTRGPYTIRGYFRAAEHNASAFTVDGFYRTGDIVRMTAGGNLVVEGRIKDQINRGGEKIAAIEIEQQLLLHPGVRDVAVVAMHDAWLGERSCAFIVASDGHLSPGLRELRTFLRAHGLAEFKLPDRVEQLAALPQTAFGKTDKRALRQRLAGAAQTLINTQPSTA